MTEKAQTVPPESLIYDTPLSGIVQYNLSSSGRNETYRTNEGNVLHVSTQLLGLNPTEALVTRRHFPPDKGRLIANFVLSLPPNEDIYVPKVEAHGLLNTPMGATLAYWEDGFVDGELGTDKEGGLSLSEYMRVTDWLVGLHSQADEVIQVSLRSYYADHLQAGTAVLQDMQQQGVEWLKANQVVLQSALEGYAQLLEVSVTATEKCAKVHGDPHGGNIITIPPVGREARLAIIDFEQGAAELGDPMRDVQTLLRFDRDFFNTPPSGYVPPLSLEQKFTLLRRYIEVTESDATLLESAPLQKRLLLIIVDTFLEEILSKQIWMDNFKRPIPPRARTPEQIVQVLQRVCKDIGTALAN